MRAAMMFLVTVGLVVVLAMAQDPPPPPGPKTEAEAQTEAVKVVVPLMIPPKDKSRKNPVPRTDANLEFGIMLHSSQCSMCHGSRGAGDGDLAQRLQMTMPDFTDPEQQKKRTDGELFYILTNGHGRMPAEHDRLSEEYRWKMILAMREMKR